MPRCGQATHIVGGRGNTFTGGSIDTDVGAFGSASGSPASPSRPLIAGRNTFGANSPIRVAVPASI